MRGYLSKVLTSRANQFWVFIKGRRIKIRLWSMIVRFIDKTRMKRIFDVTKRTEMVWSRKAYGWICMRRFRFKKETMWG